MKKGCELCSRAARMYCDSDQASLCWDCDERVHSANFLVAKHSRNLLCHVCQSVTQWKASGSKFGPTFSVCQICFNNNQGSGRRRRRRDQDQQEEEAADSTDRLALDSNDEQLYTDTDTDSQEEEEDGDIDAAAEEEEDGENQVVPWTTPSPPVATTSSSEIGSDAAVDSALKRSRETTFPNSEDEDDGCCSSQVNIEAGVRTTTRIIDGSVGPSQQSEGKRVRRLDMASSFMGFQER